MSRLLERSSLFLLLVVIALRPLIGESYHSSRTGISAAITQVSDPLPATTLAIDAVILLAAVGWLAARALGRANRYRRCGIEWGALLMAVAGVLSCCVAGNARTAINATVDWLCLPLLTVVLVQLLRHGWQVRLTLCVILASAAAQAAECFNQVFDTFPETERMYEANKADFWAAAKVELDAPQVALFEHRMHAREASGFLAHSNVAGAYLVMTCLAALGLAGDRWRSSPTPAGRALAVMIVLLAGAVCVAALLTGSKGALVAGGAALVFWIARLVYGGWFDSHRRRVLAIGWGSVVLAAAATVGLGLSRGELPGSSLDFRWQYWTASWQLFADHWTTGVGRENFGAHYLQYKSIQSPEEVANPHNLVVTAATEWGLLGAVGVGLMLVGGSVAATRGSSGQSATSCGAGRSLLAWAAATGATMFLLRVFLLGSDQPAYLLYATVVPLMVWAGAFALCATQPEGCQPARSRLATAINFGLLAFLLQDTINFAAFVPGAATTFFALLAVSIAECGLRNAESSSPLKKGTGSATTSLSDLDTGVPRGACLLFQRRNVLLAVAGIALLAAHVGWLLVPVARSDIALRRARASAGQIVPGPYESQPAYANYLRAAEADPLDPTPHFEAAAYLIGYAETSPTPQPALAKALDLIDAAIELDRYSTQLHRQKLQMCHRAFALTGDPQYLRSALAPARKMTELYPQSPTAHADLGETLLAAGHLAEAVNHLSVALNLDDARPEWEELRRLPTRQRDEIQAQITEASALLRAAEQ